MISIIVSSYNEKYFDQFCASVESTIGVTYEIIKVNNNNIMGTSEAYNLGAQKAKYSFLCFSHEDIIFKVKNWGLNIINEFNSDLSIGIIGVAGGTYKTFVPSGWFSSVKKSLNHIHVDYFDAEKPSSPIIHEKELSYEVKSLDGCFFATRFEIWQKHKFDEVTFIKYHCYDLDFSLNVGQSYKLIVSKNVYITHHSHGNFNREWLFETYKLHTKWRSTLPRKPEYFTKEDVRNLEVKEFENFMNHTFQIKSNMIRILNILFSLKAIKLFGIRNWFTFILKSINRIKFLILRNRKAF